MHGHTAAGHVGGDAFMDVHGAILNDGHVVGGGLRDARIGSGGAGVRVATNQQNQSAQ